MSNSRWSKMSDAEKKAYYAARKARKAAKAKAVDPAKKPDTKKPAPKACPCKAEPKKEEPANLSVGEKQLLEQVRRATKERLAVENAVARIGRMLLELTCVFRPETTFIRFCVEENGKVVSYYGGNAAKKVGEEGSGEEVVIHLSTCPAARSLNDPTTAAGLLPT